MVAWGREHTAADLRAGTLRDLPADRPESCITMWDYIEHALDPRGDLEAAFARLEPGGIARALHRRRWRSALARDLAGALAPDDAPPPQLLLHRGTIGSSWSRSGSRSESDFMLAVYPRYVAHAACLMADVRFLGRTTAWPHGSDVGRFRSLCATSRRWPAASNVARGSPGSSPARSPRHDPLGTLDDE